MSYLLIQPRVPDGSGGVAGKGLHPPGVFEAELSRPGAAHAQEAHCHAAKLDGNADVGPPPRLVPHRRDPVGVERGVGHNDRLPRLCHFHQVGVLGHGDIETRGLYLLSRKLVPSPSGQTSGIILDQYNSEGVPGDDPFRLLQDVSQHLLGVQGTADDSSRLLQRLGQFPLLMLRLEQPRVLDGDGRLVSKGGYSRHIVFGQLLGIHPQCTNDLAFYHQRGNDPLLQPQNLYQLASKSS